jgi:hypothetical protein
METFYLITFVVLGFCTACLEWFKSTGESKPYQGNKAFLGFRDNYLLVYSTMMGTGLLLLKTSFFC